MSRDVRRVAVLAAAALMPIVPSGQATAARAASSIAVSPTTATAASEIGVSGLPL